MAWSGRYGQPVAMAAQASAGSRTGTVMVPSMISGVNSAPPNGSEYLHHDFVVALPAKARAE